MGQSKSIFPILSLQKRARIFQHIGSKPIGWLLFQRTNPNCERRVIYLEEGWTRQSCYTWHGCKFIVQETFYRHLNTLYKINRLNLIWQLHKQLPGVNV